MPQQYVNLQGGGNTDMSNLLTNLAENVRYRRAMEKDKAAAAAKLEQDMANGLIPSLEGTVTDRGLEFDNDVAKTSFYQAMGRKMGRANMSQEGYTNSKAYLENDAAAEAEAAVDRQAAEQDKAMATQVGIDNNLINATNDILENGAGILDVPDPDAAGPTQETWDKYNTRASAPEDPGKTTTSFTNVNVPLPGGGVVPVKMPVKGNFSGNEEPSTPAPDQTPNVKPPDRVSGTDRESQSRAVDIQRSLTRNDTTASVDQYSNTVTEKKSQILDEIQTDQRSLLGMSAFRDVISNVGASYFGQDRANNPYQTMYDQRTKDLERWEKALSGDGTTNEMKKIGTSRVTRGGYSGTSHVKTKEAIAKGASMNMAVNGPKGRAEDRTIGKLKGLEGTDWYKDSNGDVIWKSLSAQDVGDEFLIPGTTKLRLLSVTKNGKTDKGILDTFVSIMDPTMNPKSKDYALEVVDPEQGIVYYKGGNTWETKDGQPAHEPGKATQVKIWDARSKDQLFSAGQAGMNANNLPEWIAASLSSGARGAGVTPDSGNH